MAVGLSLKKKIYKNLKITLKNMQNQKGVKDIVPIINVDSEITKRYK